MTGSARRSPGPVSAFFHSSAPWIIFAGTLFAGAMFAVLWLWIAK